MSYFMKKFLQHIKESFGSSAYYAQAKNESTGKGIIFVLKLCAFLGIIIGIVAITVVLFIFPKIKAETMEFVDNAYPDELVVTIKDNALTANISEPLFVANPFPQANEDRYQKNIAVLAPQESANPALFETYDVPVVFTNKAVIVGTPEDTRTLPYGKDGIITKVLFMNTAQFVMNFLGTFIYFMVIPSALVAMLILAIAHMLWLFVVSLLIFLLFKMIGPKLTYKEIYRLGLRALIPLMIIEVVLFPLSLGLSGRLLTTVVVFMIIYFSTFEWKKSESGSVTPQL